MKALIIIIRVLSLLVPISLYTYWSFKSVKEIIKKAKEHKKEYGNNPGLFDLYFTDSTAIWGTATVALLLFLFIMASIIAWSVSI